MALEVAGSDEKLLACWQFSSRIRCRLRVIQMGGVDPGVVLHGLDGVAVLERRQNASNASFAVLRSLDLRWEDHRLLHLLCKNAKEKKKINFRWVLLFEVSKLLWLICSRHDRRRAGDRRPSRTERRPSPTRPRETGRRECHAEFRGWRTRTNRSTSQKTSGFAPFAANSTIGCSCGMTRRLQSRPQVFPGHWISWSACSFLRNQSQSASRRSSGRGEYFRTWCRDGRPPPSGSTRPPRWSAGTARRLGPRSGASLCGSNPRWSRSRRTA